MKSKDTEFHGLDIHVRSHADYGPSITIHCPLCHTRNASATTARITESPGNRITDLVKCGSCQGQLESKIAVLALRDLSADEIEQRGLLRRRLDLMLVFLPVLSAATAWVGIGLIFAILALILNWRSAFWLRLLCWVVLAGNIAWGIYFLLNLPWHRS